MSKEEMQEKLYKVSCFLSLLSCLDEQDVDSESIAALSLDYKNQIDAVCEYLNVEETESLNDKKECIQNENR